VTAASGPGAPVFHAAEPLPKTAVTIGGRRHLLDLDMAYPDCWPAEAICRCGVVLRREAVTEPWVHTGRRPGEAG
jgi:hypothetical protein